MPRVCTVCSHKDTEKIDQAIVEGQPHTSIAKQYGLNHLAIRRHSENHLPEKLMQAWQEKETDHAEGILSGIHNLLEKTRGILEQAEKKGYHRLQLEAIKEMRNTYELLSKIAVKLAEYEQARGSGSGEDTAPRSLADLYAEDQQEMNTLDALTDEELKTFTRLQAKIAGTIPEDDRDERTRIFVAGTNESASYDSNSSNNSGPDSPNAKETETKNTKNREGKGMVRTKPKPEPDSFDDWEPDFDDLDIEDLDL